MRVFLLMLLLFCFKCGFVNGQNHLGELNQKPTSVMSVLENRKDGTSSQSSRYSKSFNFNGKEFVSLQFGRIGFVVYDFKGMSASDLKSSVISIVTTLSAASVNNIEEIVNNSIRVDGSIMNICPYNVGDDVYNRHIDFHMVIQFKDEKVRYDAPVITQIYTDSPLGRPLKLNMDLPIGELIEEPDNREELCVLFNKIIDIINSNIRNNMW